MKIDAGYLYRNDRLSVVHIKADSGAAFDPLLATSTKRYGAGVVRCSHRSRSCMLVYVGVCFAPPKAQKPSRLSR